MLCKKEISSRSSKIQLGRETEEKMKEDLESQVFRKVSLPLHPQLMNSGQMNQKGIQQGSTSLPLLQQNTCPSWLKLLILTLRPLTGHYYKPNKPYTANSNARIRHIIISHHFIIVTKRPPSVLSLPLTQACFAGDQNPQALPGRPYMWTSHSAW